MKKVLMLCLLMVLTGCATIGPSTNYQLDVFLENYCADRELSYVGNGLIYETDIENIGYYGIGKVSGEDGDFLIFLIQNFPTELYETGFNQIGPLFDIDGKEFMITNLDEIYGNGKNYYIYIVDRYISSASYNDGNVEVENVNYVLNGEDKTFSVMKFEFDKEVIFDENLLILNN